MTITSPPATEPAATDDLTVRLADYAVGVSYDDLPGTVVESAKLFTVECIGHMVHSRPQPVSHLIVDMVRSLEAVPQAAVVGSGFRTSFADAAYANAALAHADELEACGSLPGTGLIPPIAAGLAIGERAGEGSGRAYLTALVTGVEVQGRLGTAAIGACDRGFMGFSFVGPAGAFVTAARLLDFDSAQVRNGLGTVLPLAGGSLRGDGYMSHVHEAGIPARTGVWAALLVERGFTASPDYLDGLYSWGEQFVGPAAGRPYDAGAITAGLGDSFFLETSDVAPKLYGTSGVTHQAIEGTIRLMREHDLKPSDIADVELLVPPFALRIASFPNPVGAEQAKFSLEQAVAGLLVSGIPRLPYVHAFTDEATGDPRYVEARTRVKVTVDESKPNVRGFDAQTVTLRLVDGLTVSTVVDRLDVGGRANNPLSADDRIDVARHTLEPLGHDRAERVIDQVLNLEEHSIAELARTLIDV
jgi:2-methylcitrate dehydratase PrpD